MSLPAFQLKHMLKQQGQTSTLTQVTTGAYDPLTGSLTTSEVSYTIKAYFASYALTEGDSVTSGSRWVLVGTSDVDGNPIPEPTTSDILEGISGDKIKVTETQKIYSGDSVACYLCTGVE